MLNKIIKNNKLNIPEYNIEDIKDRNTHLSKLLKRIISENPGSIFLYRSKLKSHPAKLFALLAFYNHKDFYGLKTSASRILNIDIKNVKQYWKRFDKFKDDDLFKVLSSEFKVVISGKRGSYSSIFYKVDEYKNSRPTDLLNYCHLQIGLVLLFSQISINKVKKVRKKKPEPIITFSTPPVNVVKYLTPRITTIDYKAIFRNILQTETERYTGHKLNLNSLRSQDIINKSVYLIYYYIYLLRKTSNQDNVVLSRKDFSKFAYGFVSFFYRGKRGRKLIYLIPSFKHYIYEYFEHLDKGCGGQFSECGFCQFDDEYQPRIYKSNLPENREEGYIVKKMLGEMKKRAEAYYFEESNWKTKTTLAILSKFARFMNKKCGDILHYKEYNFKWLVEKLFDGLMLVFRKLEWLVKETWLGSNAVRLIFTGSEYGLKELRKSIKLGTYNEDWYLRAIG